MKKIHSFLLIIVLVYLPLITVNGQDGRGAGVRRNTTAKTQKRLALVIGNGSYKSSPLRNPVNDANDMAAALRAVGFEVILHTDINQSKMKRAISSFGKILRSKGGTGLFYYAGHGVQVRGRNYLIPVGAKVDTEEEVEFEGVDVGRLLAQLRSARNPMNIVILDACRNNPFARSFRSADKGLASIDAPSGTIIAYATAPGSVASDGTGRNGLYTQELLKQIGTPGVSIENAFKRVRVAVRNKTEDKQTPWESSSLTGDFYFNSAGKIINSPIGNTAPSTASTTEKTSWNLVKDSDDISDLALFLQEFPNGFYSNAARFNIKKIETDAWNLVKDSRDRKQIQSYIDKYPNSESASLARILIKQIGDKKAEEEADSKANTPKTGTVKANAIGMELVYIPAGEFMMGSTAYEVEEAFRSAKLYFKGAKRKSFSVETPRRKVTIKEGFWMGKFEVTQEQYEQVMGNNPSKFKKKCGARCPVEKVSWKDAKVFIGKLNAKNDGFKYSLPSEAEWEYAARAGTATAFSYGNSLSSIQANFDGKKPFGGASKGTNLGKTTPVGSYQPNNWGLYDMHGNVWEWVEDIYNDSYLGLPVDGSANKSLGDPDKRVLRGGSFGDFGCVLRSAFRIKNSSSDRYSFLGFRVAARPSGL